MKKIEAMRSIAVIALAAVLLSGIMMVSCGDSPSVSYSTFLSGEFLKDSNTVRYALYKTQSRAAGGASQTTLAGDLEDGNFLIKLNGFYDEATETYKASAASSLIRYSLTGSVAPDGSHISTATIAVNNGISWVTFTVPVTGKDVDITATDNITEKSAVLPASLNGKWYMASQGDHNMPHGWQSRGDGSFIVWSGTSISSIQMLKYETNITGVGEVTLLDSGGGDSIIIYVDKYKRATKEYWEIIFVQEKYDEEQYCRKQALEDFFIEKHVENDITFVDSVEDMNIGSPCVAVTGYGTYYKFYGDEALLSIIAYQYYMTNYYNAWLESHGHSGKHLQYARTRFTIVGSGLHAGDLLTENFVNDEGEFELPTLDEVEALIDTTEPYYISRNPLPL